MQFPPPCYGDSERRAMSALWSIVDITSLIEKVRYVPKADIQPDQASRDEVTTAEQKPRQHRPRSPR